MSYWMDVQVPQDVWEDAIDCFGHPVDARADLRCDDGEHYKVRAYKETKDGGRMATFVCKECGENLVESNGNWVPQDGWEEADWEDAYDWDDIRERFQQKVDEEKERRKRRIQEFCESRIETRREKFSVPSRDASGPEWHNAFSSVSDSQLRREVYGAYLESEWWRSRRERVLEEKGRKCRLQYPGCTGSATEIHHKSYDMIGFEPLHDLEPVCSHCHERFHEVQ